MKSFLWGAIFMLAISSQVHGHLCDNIFKRADRLIIKPERDFIRIEKKGILRIFLKNGYPASLHNVRIVGKSDAFQVEVIPPLIQELRPGEKIYFSLELAAKEGAKYGNHPLEIWVGARQFRLRKIEGVTLSFYEIIREELKKSLEDPNWYVKTVACEELAKLGDPSGLTVLKEALDQKDEYIRGFAARALGEFDSIEAITLVKKAMEDEKEFVRGSGVSALSIMRDTANVTLLKKVLKDASEFVRICAASALLILGDESMLPLVKEKIRSEDKLVSVVSCESLGIMGDTLAIHLLEEALEDSNWVVSALAGKALVRIREKKE